jgi:lysophospholipid acyltransferase (LPLAT)-like uncharacterized protein
MPKVVARSSAVVVPHAPRWQQRLAGWLVFAAMKLVTLTLRYHWSDRSGYFTGQRPGPAIFCIWHNRLALSMVAYFGYVKKHSGGVGLGALVSASKDGGFLAGVLQSFGVQPVRGSSSRRGAQALRELTTWAKRGFDLAITPDGPRGPRYVVQPGVIALAQVTEMVIVPVSCNLGWKIQLKSWDKFQIPLPFSRCEMIYEKPIRVPREATEAEREALRVKLEETMRGMAKD